MEGEGGNNARQQKRKEKEFRLNPGSLLRKMNAEERVVAKSAIRGKKEENGSKASWLQGDTLPGPWKKNAEKHLSGWMKFWVLGERSQRL